MKAQAGQPVNRRGATLRRQAFVLAAVLALAMLVSALGLSFLEAHSTVYPEALNRAYSVRAQNMAASGVSLAGHYLMYPLDGVALTSYWKGASGIAIDATADRVDVSVLRADEWAPPLTDKFQFRITATGMAYDPKGVLMAQRTVTAEVLIPPNGRWVLPYACMSKTSAFVESSTYLYGNLHVEGWANGYGWSQNEVRATSTASWWGSGPPSAKVSGAASVAMPAGTISNYATYSIHGRDYTAYSFNSNTMSGPDSTALNAIDMSATNPGRIILTKSGSLTLKSNVVLNGTLLCDDEVMISGSGIQITAVEGFPAIVCLQDLALQKDGAGATFNGAVICGNQLDGRLIKNATLTIRGPLIVTNGFNDLHSSGTKVYLYYDLGRTFFWDLENAPKEEPITYLSWKES